MITKSKSLLIFSSVLGLVALFLFLWLILPAQAAGSPSGVNSPEAPAAVTPDISGMIAYWPLDDPAGSTIFMDVLAAQNGTCTGTGCPSQTAGKVNGAFTFDGVDDGISVPDSPALNWGSADSFSVELWVRSPACTSVQVFIGKYVGTGGGTWWVGCDETNRIAFSLRDASNKSAMVTSTNPILDNNWHYVVAIRDAAANQNLLYVDGVSAAPPASIGYTDTFASDDVLSIGYFNAGSFYRFTGAIDEVALYNKALTLQEIQFHYQAGNGQSYANDPPVAGPDGPYTLAEDTSQSFTAAELLANDSDVDTDHSALVISAVDTTSAQGGTITGSGPYLYTPKPNFFGTDTFNYMVSDGEGGTGVGTVTMNVTSVQDPLTLTNPGAKSGAEGDSINFQIPVSNPDQRALTFSATGLPPNLSINPGTGLISGVISYDASPGSPYNVTVSVHDDYSPPQSDSETFVWNVANTNRPPTITKPDDRSEKPGKAVSLQIQASDPDNDAPLTYSAKNLPGGLSINPNTGLITGTLQAEGRFIVTITVKDPNGGSSDVIFIWRVDDFVELLPLVVHTVASP